MPKNTYKKKVSKATKTYVKQILDKEVEDKQLVAYAPGIGPVPITNVMDPAFLINGSPTGTSAHDRIGAKIRAKKLNILGYIEPIIQTADSLVRMLILWDKQPNGLPPDYDTLFANNGTPLVASQYYNAPINVNAHNRYVVLRDKYYMGHINGGANNIGHRIPLRFNINLKNRVTIYKGNTAFLADIQTNALYVIFTSETNASWQLGGFQASMIYEDA